MLHFDADSHTYTLDGRVVPSVTQLIRPLEADALARIPENTLEWKRGLGEQVHLACQLDDEGDLDEDNLDQAIYPYLWAWRNFRDDHNLEILLNEMPLGSRRYRFAGTIDRVAVLNKGLIQGTFVYKGLATIDIKTRVDLPDAIGVQLAGYNRLVEEHPELAQTLAHSTGQMPHRVAVRLGPDGKYSTRVYTDTEDLACFTACLSLHNWMAKRK